MRSISIGKNEIAKLKSREQEVLNELNNDDFYQKNKSNSIFSFKTLRLQRELKILQTKLKVLGSEDNDVA